MAEQNKAFEFGPFRLEVRERRLTRDGHTVPLRGRVFETLYALVKRHGCLVTKDELMAIIWPESVVEETNLNHNICVLRRALGEKVTGQRYIETVPRQGYRFVADVEELDDPEGTHLARTWATPEGIQGPPESFQEQNLSFENPESQASAYGATGRALPGIRADWYQRRGVISALAVAVLLLVGYLGTGQLGHFGNPSASRILLAVLPFENLTGNSEEKYVADGLSHEIISQLVSWNTRRLGVIGRASSRVYQEAQKSIDEIGSELGVDYVVEGSVRRAGSSYRVTVMLIRVDDQAHLWAANYDRPVDVDNVTALQVELAKIISREIGIRINIAPDADSQIAYPPRM